MPSLYAEVEINASPPAVWNALIHKEDWRYWNTFLYDCDPGLKLAPGQEVFLSMQRLEGDEETEFQPVVTVLQPNQCLRWVSKIPGLRSEHSFELQEITPGRTRYLHRANFSGVLAKVFLPFIRQDERQGIRRMAHQLKRYVERQAYGPPWQRPDRRYPPRPYRY